MALSNPGLQVLYFLSHHSALVYSIVETAKASGIDVYNYLKFLLLNSSTSQTTDEDLEKLCPWNPECRETVEEMHRQEIQANFNV